MSQLPEPIPDGAYARGVEMLDNGESPAAVEQKLVASGVSVEAARSIVSSYGATTAQSQSSDGRTDMKFAAVMVGGGILVLLYTGVGSYVGWFGIIAGTARYFMARAKTR